MKAKFFRSLGNNVVRCSLCNHFCEIVEGARGACHARKNEGGELVSLVYGHPTIMSIDAIEKMPLFNFLPSSLSYSVGTLGCNFKCAACCNWNNSQASFFDNDEKEYVSPESVVEHAVGAGCESISYTHNEPTIFGEYALDIMKVAKEGERPIKNIFISNGFMSEEFLNTIIPYLDAVNIDLKSLDPEFYEDECIGKIEPVLKNLRILKEEGVHLEISTLIVPDKNDDIEKLKKVAEFIFKELGRDVPWHIIRFSAEVSWKLGDSMNTSVEFMEEVYEMGKEVGLDYVYLGNVPGNDKENTYCPNCGEIVVRRLGYNIELMDSDGSCTSCGEYLEIVK